MKQTHITLKFPARLDTDGNGFSYIDDDRMSVSCYGTNGTATAKLRAQLEREVDTALDAQRYAKKRMFFTKAGEVFIVDRRHGQWWYHIAGPGRNCSSSHGGDYKTFEHCCQAAQRHAEQSFGGVVWDYSF